MTYEEIVRKLRNYSVRYDTSEIKEHVAIQFNIYGEGEGALYLEIAEGRINVEPYEYFDRDALIYVEAKTLLDIASGRLPMKNAYEEQRFVVQGRHDKVKLLGKLQIIEQKHPSKHMKIRRLIRKEPQGRRHQTVFSRK